MIMSMLLWLLIALICVTTHSVYVSLVTSLPCSPRPATPRSPWPPCVPILRLLQDRMTTALPLRYSFPFVVGIDYQVPAPYRSSKPSTVSG